jgi:ATP-dependent DNA ligase
MKFKPRKSDTYEIIGFKEEISLKGEPKGSLGALICWDDMHTRFDVGSGFTRAEREYLWEIRATLPGKRVTVKYQHLTPGRRVPRNPIYGGFSN